MPHSPEFVLTLWHQDLICAIALFRKTRITTLVSKSQDGQILADLLSSFGFWVYRGSSSNHFSNLRKLIRHQNAIWAMALDGPRGPALVEKSGAQWLGKMGKRPIYKMNCSYSKSIRLSTWDRFHLPLPFSSLHVEWTIIPYSDRPIV